MPSCETICSNDSISTIFAATKKSIPTGDNLIRDKRKFFYPSKNYQDFLFDKRFLPNYPIGD